MFWHSLQYVEDTNVQENCALVIVFAQVKSVNNFSLSGPLVPTFVKMLVLFCCVSDIYCSMVPDNNTYVVALLEFRRAVSNHPEETLSNWNREASITTMTRSYMSPKEANK